MPTILPPQDSVTVRQEDNRVLLMRGSTTLSMPWEVALALGQALIAKAREAEATTKVQDIIQDQSILTRLGVPFGLSNDPRVQAEAKKEAQWGSWFRRMIPLKGIRSREAVGTPTIYRP